MIVFLDFDGVTHPVSGSSLFLPSCLRALEYTLFQVDAEVVITSTWRLEKSLEYLRSVLGNEIGQRIIGITPDLDIDPFIHWPRAREVVSWLEDNKLLEHEWIAIDDERGNYPDNFSYLTNNRMGFIKADIEPFIAMAKTTRDSILPLLKKSL